MRYSRRLTIFLASMTLAFLTTPMAAKAQDGSLTLFGAGSLREAMTEIAASFTKATGRRVTTSFGFSGLMREKIEAGEHADIFASADLGHPKRLLSEGRATQLVLFTRNTLCAVGPTGGRLTASTLLDRLLDPSVPLAIFPPQQDPVGDYSLAMFRRLDALRPGASAAVEARAQILNPSMLPRSLNPGEDLVAVLLSEKRIGLHITYCSTALGRLAKHVPDLEVVALPPEVRVGPEYGLALLKEARPGAAELGLFILSTEGQKVLAKHGFSPVAMPDETR